MKNGITVLTEKGETQALEYKASFDKATIESLVAFANARGGMPKSGMTNPNMGILLILPFRISQHSIFDQRIAA